MSDQLERYLAILGVRPGATKDEINTVYFALLEQLPDNPTEEDEARLQEVKHAYSILQRNYRPVVERGSVARKLRSLVPVLGLTVLVLGVVLSALNYQNIRLAVVEYHPGDVVRWNSQSEPYGKVLSYDPTHRFHTGEPSAAYEIRLNDRDETIWLSERIVIKAMVPMGAAELQAAGVGGN